jgi:hypothetical protein
MVSSDEKYQAGEDYGDVRTQSTDSFLADPLKVAKDILKDLSGVHGQATVQDIVGLITQLTHPGEPLDDKKG